MSWCNNNSTNESDEDNIDDDNDNNHHEIRAATDKTSSSTTHSHYRVIDLKNDRDQLTRPTNLTCPSCGQLIQLQDQGGIHDLPGLPAGVKFDPSDQEILEHLEAKLLSGTHHDHKLHPLIDEFIPTLEGENGICYTHPEKLPGVSKDGQIRHFFHRPSKAYTTGTRKRRKVHTDVEGNETRWHKTGKTRPIFVNGDVKGFKKILVLYTNYGRQRKPEKTNWVMHQYHFGNSEEEKEGEIVVSKVFYQTQPRQCGTNPNMKIDSKDSYDRKSKNIIRNNNNEHELQLQLQDDSNHARVKNSGFYNHEFYNNPPNFINYDHRNRESPPQLIPNLVVQAGGGPAAFTIQFATSDHSSQGRG